jgi:UDP-N-acetylglucosamine 4-epimerase
MRIYEAMHERMKPQTQTWSIRGGAGFIGSNLLEPLLELNQRVVGLDNFVAGKRDKSRGSATIWPK